MPWLFVSLNIFICSSVIYMKSEKAKLFYYFCKIIHLLKPRKNKQNGTCSKYHTSSAPDREQYVKLCPACRILTLKIYRNEDGKSFPHSILSCQSSRRVYYRKNNDTQYQNNNGWERGKGPSWKGVVAYPEQDLYSRDSQS